MDQGAALGGTGQGVADSPRGSPREAALVGGRSIIGTGDEAPLSAGQVLRGHWHLLSGHEQSEILDYQKVWFFGEPGMEKADGAEGVGANNGNDDDRGNYRPFPHDHLAYRYEVLRVIG